jgi:hypothetical protein
MLNSEQNVQVCDATDDDSSTTAGQIKIILHRIYIRHHRYTPETFVLMQDGCLFQ